MTIIPFFARDSEFDYLIEFILLRTNSAQIFYIENLHIFETSGKGRKKTIFQNIFST
jgi:hypothetical protein